MISGDKVRGPAYGQEEDLILDQYREDQMVWTATVMTGPHAGNTVSVAPSLIKGTTRFTPKLEKKQVWPKD